VVRSMETPMINVRSTRLHAVAAIGAGLACTLLVMSPARADTDTTNAPAATPGVLVNITTPDLLAVKQLSFRADIRVFGDPDDSSVFSPSVQYGLTNNINIGLAASLSKFQTLGLYSGGTARYAGSDIELTAKYGTKVYGKYAVSGQVGLALPNTPAQQSAHITLAASGSYSPCASFNLYVNPRAVLITDNSIVGIGLGGSVKLSNNLYWIADYTPILAGNNTLDLGTGNQKSRDIYGIGMRYISTNSKMSLDIGWTNGLGYTTGSSLTPGIGNSSAWYIALNYKL